MIRCSDTKTRYSLERGNRVNVRFYHGSKTEDTADTLRPDTRNKPDTILIHASTNDLTNIVNMMKYVTTITKVMEEMKGGGDNQVDF